MFSDYYFFCRRRSKNIWSKAKHDTILLISYWHMFWYALYSHHTLNVMIHSCILWLVGSSKLAMNGAAEWNRKRVRKYWISSSNGKLHRKIWFDKIWWDWAIDLSRKAIAAWEIHQHMAARHFIEFIVLFYVWQWSAAYKLSDLCGSELIWTGCRNALSLMSPNLLGNNLLICRQNRTSLYGHFIRFAFCVRSIELASCAVCMRWPLTTRSRTMSRMP